MNKHAIQLDTGSATVASRAVDVWQSFFYFTADSERVLA